MSDVANKINGIIKKSKVDTNLISDGYHTFGELYDHRIRLYITVCKSLQDTSAHVIWCSKTHSDGSVMDGWFILGINEYRGKQITYHLPNKYWKEVSQFANVLDEAPEFDGHSSEDVLNRLAKLV